MNRNFFLVFALVILANIASVSAYDVAYIVKTSGNSNVELALTQLGYTYKIIPDSQITATDFSQYSLLLIQDNVANKDSLPLKSKNSIFLNDLIAESVWTGIDVWISQTFSSRFEQLGAPFTEGFSSLDFNAYTATKSIYYLKIKPSYITRVALTTGSGTPAGIVAYSNQNGLRNVFFGFYEANFWTDDTKKLFKNSLKWIRMGVDFDGDGFYSDSDCNDNDKNLWRYLDAYADSDKDGFGAGNLVQVCSGNELPAGYSIINGDCNDNNINVNPNGVEVPYDGLDNDCKNGDLADVDNDGYCKEGYLIQNKNLQCLKETGEFGTDCNDNDITINLGSSDVYKNCVNDAPIIKPINKIIVHENEKAIVTINAKDPENDLMTYFIDDDRFVQDSVNKNMFTWQTDYNDEENYKFEVIADDGELDSSIEFDVEVLGKNRVPSCNAIPALIWKEDEKAEINLDSYCSDLDGDDLIFSLKEMPSEHNVLLEKIENGIAFFSAKKDWNGQEWAVFRASDGIDDSETNKIILKVNPVNDKPVLIKNIDKITWNEDSDLIDKINLNEYFLDIDSSGIFFTVSSNSHVEIRITNTNGKVSFYPEKDWFGKETIVFSAKDQEFEEKSNNVEIEVLDINEPPVFNEIACKKNILEDTEESCELSATDIESEALVFSIVSERHMKCTIEGNNLKYISQENYYGEASCNLRVTDASNSYSELLFEVQIENVNDAPEIKDYSPKEDISRVLGGTSKIFSITKFDMDSLVTDISWFINNEKVGNESSFSFNKPAGDYNLSVSVSDNEFTAFRSWNVLVRGINNFRCSEVNGNICLENQICTAGFLGVYDSERCCPAACSQKPPEFKAVKKSEANKTSEIIVDIREPTNLTKIELGDIISVDLSIENRLENKSDFDAEIYLYDMTKERAIEKQRSSFALDSDTKKSLSIELKTEYDLNEKNNYAIFVRVLGETKDHQKYYNEDYNEITLKRKDKDVIIRDIRIEPETGMVCGDFINAEVIAKNLGTDTQYAYIGIENPDLKIKEKIVNPLKIEAYDEEDEVRKLFVLAIPENAKAGVYKFKASVSYSDKIVYLEKEITLDECKEQIIETKTIETLRIESQKPAQATEVVEDRGKIIFLLLNLVSFTLMFLILIGFSFYKNRSMLKKSNKNINTVRNKARKAR